MRMTNPNMPRQPMQPNPRKPRSGAAPMTPKPLGSVSPRPLVTPGKPSPIGMKKGGEAKMRDGGMAMGKKMAPPNMPRQPMQPNPRKPRPGAAPMTPKPFGSLPRNPNLPTPKPGPQMAMKDGGMAHGTKAKKGRGMAIMIAIGKPKGRGK